MGEPLLTGQGSEALVGVSINAPAPAGTYSAGHFDPDLLDLDAPDAATTAAGATGLLTVVGLTVKFAYILTGMRMTAPSDASDPALDLTLKHLAISGLTNSLDTRVLGKRVWADFGDGRGYIWIGDVDNTTETLDFNLAITSPLLDPDVNPMPSASTVGNYSFTCLDRVKIDFEPQYKEQDVPELTGGAGKNEGPPGAIVIQGSMDGSFRAGGAVPVLMALCGEGVVTPVSDEWTQIITWNLSASKRLPRDLTMFIYKGGSFRPELFYNVVSPGISLKMSGEKVVEDTVSLVGLMHGLAGIGTHSTAYAGTAIMRGRRADPYKDTTDYMLKCTSAPTGGVFKIKPKISGAYSNEYTLYYDPTSKRMTRGSGAQVCDWWEGVNESGIRIGEDRGENRLPADILFTGDITTLPLNAEITIPREMLIPKVSATGTDPAYTNVLEMFPQSPRMTGAHCFVKKNGVVQEALDASFAIQVARPVYGPLGPNVRHGIDHDYDGYFAIQAGITQRYRDRSWETIYRENDKVSMEILLEGELILKWAPGVYSVHRETVSFTMPHCKVTEFKAPVNGPGRIMNGTTLQARQPSDRTKDLCTIVSKSYHSWLIPA